MITMTTKEKKKLTLKSAFPREFNKLRTRDTVTNTNTHDAILTFLVSDYLKENNT